MKETDKYRRDPDARRWPGAEYTQGDCRNGVNHGFRGKVMHFKTCLENVIQQFEVRQPEKEAAVTRPISKN